MLGVRWKGSKISWKLATCEVSSKLVEFYYDNTIMRVLIAYRSANSEIRKKSF